MFHNSKVFFCYPSNLNKFQISPQRTDLIRQKSYQDFDFSDVIYTTSKNELKMMWLSRKTNIFKNGKLMPVLCDQVTQHLDSMTISPVRATSKWHPKIQGKRIMDRM